MSRIQIDFPSHSIYTTNISVRITDLNYGGHLGNDAMLSILHEARVRFLKNYDYTELNVEGAGIIMSDVAIQFKSEAFYGENLTIEIATGDFTRVSFDIFYIVKCDERIVAIAKTGIVFFDYEKRKVVNVPEVFAKRFSL